MSDLSRLRWRCRRGMRELDVVLLGYLESVYPSADRAHQAAFARLLDCQDPEILDYLTGRQSPSESTLADVILSIRSVYRPRGA